MRIVHTTPTLNLEGGGPARSVSQLCAAISDQVDKVTILTHNWPDKETIGVDSKVEVRFCDVPGNINREFYKSSGFKTQLERIQNSGNISLIHHHGLWLRLGHDTLRFARSEGIPVVLAPRGMLKSWAKNHKAWKKRFAWIAYQRNDLQSADVFHSTSEDEALSIRKAGFSQPIAVIPNGVNPLKSPPVAERKQSESRRLLFLSRIDVVKGIPLLLEAWKRLNTKGWVLTIAGNDFGNHLREVQRLIRTLGIEKTVEVHGPAYNEEKDWLLRSSDLFILPSYSENFGIVIAEALQYGIPVIASRGTPWRELDTYNCGWWVEPTVEGVFTGLQQAFDLTDKERWQMGAAGQQLIYDRYLWPKIALDMTSLYKWVLGEGPEPPTLVS